MDMAALLLGTLGTLLILAAFVLDEFVKAWNQNSVRYNLMNIAGAGLLLYYAFTLPSLPFMALNAAWIVAAIIKLGRLMRNAGQGKRHRHSQ